MNLLAFDTSTEWLAVAAAGPAGLACHQARGGAEASATLLPLAWQQLQRAGLAWRDLDLVAFGRGPGAFTGLRTSCAVAQGLGLGLSLALLPLDSLQIVAEDALAQWQPAPPAPAIAVLMDARMGEIYAAAYRRGADGWQVLSEPALYTLAACEAWLAEAALHLQAVAGSALAAFGARLRLPPHLRSFPTEGDRAAAVLRLALAESRPENRVDAALALPVYLRDKVALTTAEREARKAAGLELAP